MTRGVQRTEGICPTQLPVSRVIGNIGTGPRDTKINFGGYPVYQELNPRSRTPTSLPLDSWL